MQLPPRQAPPTFRARLLCLLAAFVFALGFANETAALAAAAPQTPADKAEYARRFRALDKRDAEGFAKLGLWCRERKLETYAKLCFKKALRADRSNATANKAVGNVEYEGKWLTPAQYEEVKAAEAAAAAKVEAAKRAKVAKKRGTPLIPAGEDELSAAVGRSFSKGASKALQFAQALADGASLDLDEVGAAQSEHVRIAATSASADEAQHLCAIGEFAYRKLSWITFGKAESHRFRQWGGLAEFALADDPEMEATIDLVQKRWPQLVGYNDFKSMPVQVRKNKLEFVSFLDPPVHLHWNPSNRESTVANTVGRAVVGAGLASKFVEPRLGGGERNNSMMNWLLEGAGIWASLEAVGVNDLYRIDGARYAGDELVKKGMMIDWCGMSYEIATTRKAEGRDARTFPQLCRSKLRTWSRADLVLSFALFDWIVRARQLEYRKLVARLAQGSFREGFVDVFGTQSEKQAARRAIQSGDDNGLMDAFESAAERFDKEWRAWASKAYAPGGPARRAFEAAPFRIAEPEAPEKKPAPKK